LGVNAANKGELGMVSIGYVVPPFVHELDAEHGSGRGNNEKKKAGSNAMHAGSETERARLARRRVQLV